MSRVFRKQKGSSGFQTVNYRDGSGYTHDALLTGSQALGVPTGLAVTPQGTPGSTTYGYRVSALSGSGETTAAAEVTTATGNATLTVGNFNRVTWTAVTGATGYRIYGRTAAAELLMATVGQGILQFDDTGTITPSGALPGSNTALTYNVRVGSLGGANDLKNNVGVRTAKAQTNVIW